MKQSMIGFEAAFQDGVAVRQKTVVDKGTPYRILCVARNNKTPTIRFISIKFIRDGAVFWSNPLLPLAEKSFNLEVILDPYRTPALVPNDVVEISAESDEDKTLYLAFFLQIAKGWERPQ